MDFQLDSRLQADTTKVGELKLCDVLLANDANYPWLILVPRRPGLIEIHEMTDDDANLLLREIRSVSSVLKAQTSADKINVAALGNQVSQLHVHVIARFRSDLAWPGPVWGASPASSRSDEETSSFIEQMRTALSVN